MSCCNQRRLCCETRRMDQLVAYSRPGSSAAVAEALTVRWPSACSRYLPWFVSAKPLTGLKLFCTDKQHSDSWPLHLCSFVARPRAREVSSLVEPALLSAASRLKTGHSHTNDHSQSSWGCPNTASVTAMTSAGRQMIDFHPLALGGFKEPLIGTKKLT